MEIYVISDTHFGHVKLQDADIRPKDNDARLWAGIDALPDDCILMHLGDLTLGHDAITHMTLAKYKFKKWLILGNHDNHSTSYYVRNGWDFVGNEVMINMFGHNILFSHYPLPKRDGVGKNIHGHLHGGKSRGFPDFYDEDYHIEVTPEVIGYRPAKLGNKML